MTQTIIDGEYPPSMSNRTRILFNTRWTFPETPPSPSPSQVFMHLHFDDKDAWKGLSVYLINLDTMESRLIPISKNQDLSGIHHRLRANKV